jgi:hypothetical protein
LRGEAKILMGKNTMVRRYVHLSFYFLWSWGRTRLDRSERILT